MNIEVVHRIPADGLRLRSLVERPELWSAVLGAGRVAGVRPVSPDAVELELALDLYRPLNARIRLDLRDERTLAWQLVEGEVLSLDGELTVEDQGLRWRQELDFALSIPPALLREVADLVVPGWLAAIGELARG